MSFEWEVFTQKASSRSNAIRVSLSPRGIFALNQRAFEALQESKTVEMLFDKATKQFIGIRPCDAELKHAYELKQQGKSLSYYIRGKAFCNHYGIQPEQTVLFEDIEVNNGVLMLNLEKVSFIASKAPRTKTQDTPLLDAVEETVEPELPEPPQVEVEKVEPKNEISPFSSLLRRVS